MSTAELASSYAALILADEGVQITVSTPEQTPLLALARRSLPLPPMRNLQPTA
jgi:hypothetical protein